MRRNNTQSGFTLLELLVVIALLGITAAIAVPNFGRLISSSQKTAVVNDISGLLSFARTEAVRRGAGVVVFPHDASNTSKGYGVCLVSGLADCKADTADSETLLRTTNNLPSGVSVDQTTDLSFNGRGMANPGQTYEVCGKSGSAAVEIVVNAGGQVRTTDNGNKICP